MQKIRTAHAVGLRATYNKADWICLTLGAGAFSFIIWAILAA